MLEFDAETAAMLERAYQGRDFVRRRHANLAALAPRRGEAILDIGCGPGIALKEIAGAVGTTGRAAGIDPSPDMLAKARAACDGLANVDIARAPADALPFPDGAFDAAFSLQVFEYFDDLLPALGECRRVLRPGGRLVIGDMHWDTLAWHSGDPDRNQRMIDCWDRHLADRVVPARLLSDLPAAGLEHVETLPLAIVDTALRADGLAEMMKTLMVRHALGDPDFEDAEALAWDAEQDGLVASGRFFFSITHMITVARRP